MLVASVVPKWQQNFIISAIALAVILVVWIVTYGFLEKRMSEGELEVNSSDTGNEHTPKMGKLSRISGLPVLLVISLTLATLSNGIKMVTPVMIMESYDNMPAAVATRLSIILIVFSVFGVFLTNIIREKITRNEVKAIILLLIVSLPVAVVSCFVGRLHYLTILVFLAVAVAFLQSSQPFSNSFAAARFTIYGRGGTVSGLLNATAAMGNLFASYVFPVMAETLPWSYIAMLWCGLIVFGVLLSLSITRLWTEFIEMDHIFN